MEVNQQPHVAGDAGPSTAGAKRSADSSDSGSSNRDRLSIVIVYSSLDAAFLRETVAAAAAVSSDVVLVCLTHFFDGVEDAQGWSDACAVADEHPEVMPLLLPWNARLANLKPNFWPCEMRMRAFSRTRTTSDWILFIDGDEVLNPETFQPWFASIVNKQPCTMKLACYWYFLHRRRRARKWQDSIVLAHRNFVHMESFRHPSNLDREIIHAQDAASLNNRMVLGLDGLPMIHHFSWVRTQEELLRKVQSWGHRNDRANWPALVKAAFADDLLTTPDFVFGSEHAYEILPENA